MYENIHAYMDVPIMMHGDHHANQPWVAESRCRPPFFWRGWPTSMQLHGCMRHHFVFYVYMDIYLYIIICIYIIIYIYLYIFKKKHSATHVHIYTYPTSATLPCWASCLRHPLHSCRMAACVCSAQPSKQPVATTDVFFLCLIALWRLFLTF